LIKGLISADSLVCSFGASESYKTFLALDRALCVACGTPYHGRSINTQGPVFYIVGEGHEGFKCRVRAWELTHGIDLSTAQFYVSNHAASILDERSAHEVVEAVNELAEAHGDPVYVVIDTLNRNFGPGDESSTSDMTRFITFIDQELRARFACVVEVVHHPGLKEHDRSRGSGTLRAALDWEYRVTRSTSGHVTVACTKSKDYAPPSPLVFKPKEVALTGWLDEDGETMTSLVMESVKPTLSTQNLTSSETIAIDALRKATSQSMGVGVSLETWRDMAIEAGISSSSKRETQRRAFSRIKADLHKASLVAVKGGLWRPSET